MTLCRRMNMANFNIPENPEYIDLIRMFETGDPGHADLFNAVIERLIHNDAFLKLWQEAAKQHIEDKNNPHESDKHQIGLGNVDNTSDEDKPVSNPVQAALDALYMQLTGYTDSSIADLIGSAPSTLDTLGEVAQAMQDNNTVVDALEQAIGSKANAAEFDSHEIDTTKHITDTERNKWNAKQDPTGDAKDNTVTFTSNDTENPTSWTSMILFKSKEKLSSLLNKVSIMAKNVRYLYKMLGTTDISGVGDVTVTGALSQINSNLTPTWGDVEINADVVTTAGVAGIQWHKRGGVCIVYVNAKINISANRQTVLLASNIPYALFGYEPRGVVIDVDTGKAFVLKVTNRTNLSIYTGTGAPYQGTIAGAIVYVCSSQ